MQRRTSDWAGNVFAFAVVIVVNILSNALPINGQSMPEISAKYPSLFTLAGFTFSIWGIIYLSLLAFVIYQALPAQRDNEQLAGIARLFQVNCAANSLWIVVWHYDLLWVSMILMVIILVTLVRIYRSLLSSIDGASLAQHILMYLPFSLYTAWISVATIANLSVIQTANNWDDVAISAVGWTLLKIALAGAVGASIVLRLRDVPFVLVIAWAAYGISVKQASTPAVAGAATTLAMLALMLAIREAAVRIASRK